MGIPPDHYFWVSVSGQKEVLSKSIPGKGYMIIKCAKDELSEWTGADRRDSHMKIHM